MPRTNGPEGVGPGGPPAGAQAGVEQPKQFTLRKYPFLIQFLWQQQPRGQRLEKMAQKKAAAAANTASTSEEAPRPSS